MIHSSRYTLAIALLSLMGLVGCGGLTPGATTIAKYTRGEDPGSLVTATQTGNYALYYTTDTSPEVRTPVRAGEKVGFRMDGGMVTAIAGDYSKVLDKSVYKAFWKYVNEH
jgi:hypothetical protein